MNHSKSQENNPSEAGTHSKVSRKKSPSEARTHEPIPNLEKMFPLEAGTHSKSREKSPVKQEPIPSLEKKLTTGAFRKGRNIVS